MENNYFKLSKALAEKVDAIVFRLLENNGLKDCRSKEALEAKGFKLEAEVERFDIIDQKTTYKLIDIKSGKVVDSTFLQMKGFAVVDNV